MTWAELILPIMHGDMAVLDIVWEFLPSFPFVGQVAKRVVPSVTRRLLGASPLYVIPRREVGSSTKLKEGLPAARGVGS